MRLCDRLESQDAAGVNATIGLTKGATGDTILEQQQRERQRSTVPSQLFSQQSVSTSPLSSPLPLSLKALKHVFLLFNILSQFYKNLICDERK